MAPPGYIMPDAAIHITISADSVTATKGSENLTVTKQTGPGQEADTWQIQVKNTPGMVLPETGGRGTGAYSAFGLALVLAAAGAMLLQGKKRKNGKS